jgi:methylenetetrahydrofolate reductase (NADPH)
MGDRRASFAQIGITGYPESRHLISNEATIEAMFDKALMATYIVSHICFDAETIRTWIARVRARGTGMPIWIRPARQHRPGATRAHLDEDRPRRLDPLPANPPRLAAKGAVAHPHARRPHRGPRRRVHRPRAERGGFHLYTFNELERTERWRRGR